MTPEELQRLMDERAVETGHAATSPSQLYRLLECPGSLSLGVQAPVEPPSQYAVDGTLQHDVTAEVLLGELEKEEVEDLPVLKIGMPENIMTCIDFINATIRKFDKGSWKIRVEVKGSMAAWGFPGIYGTSDVVLSGWIEGRFHVFVIDWKFGSGVPVFAEDNDQGMAYASCHIDPTGTMDGNFVDAIHICIVQPPLNYEGEWVISTDELSNWVLNRLTHNLGMCYTNPEIFKPGIKQCKFCPAGRANMCEHKHEAAQMQAQEVFAELADKSLQEIPIERLIELFDKLEFAVKYRSEIAKFIEAQYFKGKPTPGKKFVHGRLTRSWSNEALATIFLEQNLGEEKAYERKLLTPAKAEKVNRKFKKDDAFIKLVSKKPGKPQMVDEDDKRPAIDPTSLASERFKDVADS